jgi:flagellar motility protein MotE (MotC chaperone)
MKQLRRLAATGMITALGTLLIGLSASSLSAGDEPVAISHAAIENGGGCLVDQAALEDLKKRKAELDAREQALAAKEAELAAAQRDAEEQLKKIQAVRDSIAASQELAKSENQEKVAKLVSTFEGMSPKAAAKLMSEIDESLAVATMAQISTQKLSKIMNVMEPERASRLSELLAGVARAKELSSASRDAAVAANSTKGGGITDGNVNNQHNTDAAVQRGPGSQKGK